MPKQIKYTAEAFLLSEYQAYVQNVSEGDPMEFDDWLAGSDLPEIVAARKALAV